MAEKLNICLIENGEKTALTVDEGTEVYSIIDKFKTPKEKIYGIKINNDKE